MAMKPEWIVVAVVWSLVPHVQMDYVTEMKRGLTVEARVRLRAPRVTMGSWTVMSVGSTVVAVVPQPVLLK